MKLKLGIGITPAEKDPLRRICASAKYYPISRQRCGSDGNNKLPLSFYYYMMAKYGIQNTSAFTGKERKGNRTPMNRIKYSEERDEETGFGYFGARYMDHELMTMWLSVDPMADKYPQISPYNYCIWNPMKIVDEYGMEADIPPLLARFCSAERQANSILNNPKRKDRFVRSASSSFDSDGRKIVTVRPNSNYADKYDAPSPSDGILLPTIDGYTLTHPGPTPNIGGGKVSSVMSIINTGVTHYYDNQDKKQ